MTNAQHADNFVGHNNGTYIDEDRQYGSQCWDVVARYARLEFGCPSFPTVSGGAEGLWRFFANPIPQYFDKVSRDALAPGDIAVWDASFYPPFGHTSLVWRREGNTIWSFEQDGSKDPNHDGIADGVAYLVQRTITSKLAGGLRPKNSEQGDDEMTEAEKEAIYTTINKSDKVRDEKINKVYNDFVPTLEKLKTELDRLNNAVNNLNKTVFDKKQ